MNKEDKRIYNLGYLNGWLANMARINDKTNNGFDFSLQFINKEDQNLSKILDPMFQNVAENYQLEEISNPQIFVSKEMINNWVYEYQPKSYETLILKDERGDFSLSDDEWKKEWVDEFVSLMFATMNPTRTFRISFENIKGFYACDSLDMVFENETEVYRLHFSLSD